MEKINCATEWIEDYEERHKIPEIINLEKIYKLDYIRPEFKEVCLETYPIHRKNATLHKQKKAAEKKERIKKLWLLICIV